MTNPRSRVLVFCLSLVVAWVCTPPVPAQIEIAEELLVDLDAAHPSAGQTVWENGGTMDGFEIVGNPIAEDVAGVPAVTFNAGFDLDAYQSVEPAPDGVVGFDPTRSIEVWAYNPDVANEETLVSWGYRGGPDGTNMSFNYGTHASFGAVGHWGGPDIGWNDAGGAPEAGQWHHLVYTYDGLDTFTTRVYADGCLIGDFCNSEVLGPGVINTHVGSPIVLAAQVDNEFGQLNLELVGTLSLARVRIHDGVLSEEQVLANFEAEQATYIKDTEPEFVSVPGEGAFVEGSARYQTRIVATGFPPPTIEAVAPPGATVTDGLYSYEIPDPAPASFVATVRATNRAGTAEASWTVTRENPPDGIEVAESLLVSLDAAHSSAGDFVWENQGSMADFEIIGEPLAGTVLGVPAVTFNAGPDLDAYRSLEPAAPGLVGLNPTRSIEVWVHNPSVANEETLVAWGYRGGPTGTNMSFNYGTNPDFGAVGHWGAPDLGWSAGGGAPAANAWHHLVYTFDGAETFTTRVYADGCLAGEFCNEETLAAGTINTWEVSPIVIAAQLTNAAGDLNTSLRGTLSIGRVRVHDGVLREDQVLANYEAEEPDFSPLAPPEFNRVPRAGTYFAGTTTYTAPVSAVGTPPIAIQAIAPQGATVEGGTYSYDIPDPEPDSFVATVSATNEAGTIEASWTVSRRELPPEGQVAVAEELFVNLDADDGAGGEDVWENQADSPVGDFRIIGDPIFEVFDAELEGIDEIVEIGAVTFNAEFAQDAYQSEGNATDGLVGPDATRSIEVWAYNPEILPEETLISWGRRGGPEGSNMAFNYGNNANFGAVGHWGAAGPDLGWNDAGGAPEAGRWHHLVYTYDGTTTRVYADGELQNSEDLGPGVINTHADHPITIAAQIQDASGALNFTDGIHGVLSIARIRVHDGVLFPEEIAHNYRTDIADFAGIPQGGASLKPGDVNGDGGYNVSDPVAQLNFLFSGGALPDCYVVANSRPVELTSSGLAILDFNGDGGSNVADAVASLAFLFGGGASHTLGEGCATVSGDCESNCR